jgi:hypothetical protein
MDRNEATALINVDTHELDISAIVSDHFDGQHVLQVRRKGSRHSETIMREDRKYEAFSYAILFPHGEDGWSRGCSFTFRDYLVSRMLIRIWVLPFFNKKKKKNYFKMYYKVKEENSS